MSRLLKIELDLPEFEKELNINITIKKDGEVVYSATVMEKIEDLLENLEKIASKIFIVDYSEAA